MVNKAHNLLSAATHRAGAVNSAEFLNSICCEPVKWRTMRVWLTFCTLPLDLFPPCHKYKAAVLLSRLLREIGHLKTALARNSRLREALIFHFKLP
jgi:hypothetical protein